MEARRIAMPREMEIEPAAASPPLRMTYEEFLAWADEDTHAEWVDGEDGRYHPLRVGEDGVFHSAVLPGLWLNVAWLWQDPLPPLMSVLKQWGLV
jgi:hypothetical protein